MEIPQKYILTMEEVEANKDRNTGILDRFAPIIGRKHGNTYTPEGLLTGGTEDYFLAELRSVDEKFDMLIGPAINRMHFGQTGELREVKKREDQVEFWHKYFVSENNNG